MTTLSPANPSIADEKPKHTTTQQSWHRSQLMWGWLFLSPWIIGFLIFTLMPIVVSLMLSFTDFNLNTPDQIHFIGTQNWEKLLAGLFDIKDAPLKDIKIQNAFFVTVRFAFLSVSLSLAIAIALAGLLTSKKLWGRRFFSVLYYLPYMVPAVSGIFIWQAFLNGQTGYLNRFLRLFGLEGPNWFQDVNSIIPAFIMMSLWGIGNAMLTMMAAMQGVSQELYEAAEVDGASPIVKFFRITLPMISPVVFYNLILSIIGTLQYFVVPYIVTQGTGRPNDTAYFFNMHLYKTAFTYQEMGYGATQAWFIFIFAMLVTVILFATARFWVYYGGGDA
jgi:multiple sugar transport system permease protein